MTSKNFTQKIFRLTKDEKLEIKCYANPFKRTETEAQLPVSVLLTCYLVFSIFFRYIEKE